MRQAVLEHPRRAGTPFEGLELTGQVRATFLRGHRVYDDGKVVGPARGQYLRRQTTGAPGL